MSLITNLCDLYFSRIFFFFFCRSLSRTTSRSSSPLPAPVMPLRWHGQGGHSVMRDTRNVPVASSAGHTSAWRVVISAVMAPVHAVRSVPTKAAGLSHPSMVGQYTLSLTTKQLPADECAPVTDINQEKIESDTWFFKMIDVQNQLKHKLATRWQKQIGAIT